MQRVHAVVLTGGSAYGLAAADGVMARLEAAGIGFPVPGGVVPIVPAAVVFDLGRGGDFGARPDADTGAAAVDAAPAGPVEQGVVGAGTGAVVGGLKGGRGNGERGAGQRGGGRRAGRGERRRIRRRPGLGRSCTGPGSGCPGSSRRSPVPSAGPGRAAGRRRPGRRPPPGTATTLGVVATDVTLDKAGCARLAAMGHDGLARALSPVHTAMDGDTVFGLSTAARPAPELAELVALQAAAADVVTRAVVHAVLAAHTVTTPGAGSCPAYRDSQPVPDTPTGGSAAGERGAARRRWRRRAAGRPGRARRPRRAGSCTARSTRASSAPCRSRTAASRSSTVASGRQLDLLGLDAGGGAGRGEVADGDGGQGVHVRILAHPPIALIGRSGCRKPGSSMPCPASLPHIASRQVSAISASLPPPRSSAAQVGLGAGEQAGADLAVGGQPGAVAGAAERAGHRGDDADHGRAAVDQPALGRGAAALGGVRREVEARRAAPAGPPRR